MTRYAVMWGLAISMAASHALAAQDSTPTEPPDDSYFYKGLPGSDAYAGPLDVLLNKGFNFAQAENRSRRIFEARYGTEHDWHSIVHPLASIQNSGGWGEFFEAQILPFAAWDWIASGFRWDEVDHMAWYPNYMGHFIEGGITSRKLAEKFRAQGVPYASMIAGATTMATAMVNEMYTHPEITRGTGGTVADLYLFDLGGVVVFSFDPVARFFAETLHANVWPGQAALTLPDGELSNNANNLVFKIPLPLTDRASVFFRTGIGSHLGVTAHLDQGYDLSFGIGGDADRQNLDPVTGEESVDIRLSSSLYLDRGGSVLASIHWSEVDHRLLALNVYPGVFHRDFGAWLNMDQDRAFQFGLTHRLALGLGFGASIGS